jgi:hypothetical protein
MSFDNIPVARTERGIRSDKLIQEMRGALSSSNPEIREMVKEANRELVHIKSTPGQVHVAQVLTNISLQYANDEYIGDQLMPTIVGTEGKLSAVYFTYDKRDRLAYPDDTMSDRSFANELNESRSTASVSLLPRALREYVDSLTLQNQDAPLNELLDAQVTVLDGLMFNREVRIATALTTSGNYASANVNTLAAASRWDSASGGNPLKDIDDAIKTIWSGKGPGGLVAWCPIDVWNVLKKHPMVLDLFKYNGSSPGMATPEMLAGWFGLEKILVGKARKDTANRGQTASYSRIWGSDAFGIVRVDKGNSVRNVSFGKVFTDRAAPTSTTTYHADRGTDGGYYVRSAIAESAPTVIANDAGALIATCIG